MDLSNHSYTVGDHNITFSVESGLNIFAYIGPINVVFVGVTNFILLAAILSSAQLRRQMRVQLIVCIAIADLVSGCFAAAVFSYTAINKKWTLGCPFHFLLQIIGVFADVFMTSWFMVLLNISFFVKLMDIRFPQLSPLGEKLFRIVVFSFPVFLFCVVGLPIIYTHPVNVKPSNDKFCPMYLEDPYEITMSFVCFFIPATSLVLFTVLFIAFRKETTLSRNTLALNLLEEPSMVEKPLFYVIPSLTVVLMSLPEQVATVLFFSKTLTLPKGVFMSFSILDFLRPGILPIMWLVFPDIRQAFIRIISCKNCKSTNTQMTVTNFTYKNLQAN